MNIVNNMLWILAVMPVAVMTGNAFAETLPDPTRPANYSDRIAIQMELPQQFLNWNVRAIRSSESGRNAIVNGSLVKVGDVIDSATIVDITSNSVVLVHNNKQLVLRLGPENIKKKHTEQGIKNSD